MGEVNYTMHEMKEMMNDFKNLLSEFEIFKLKHTTEQDDINTLRNLRNKYRDKIFKFLEDNDNQFEFEKNFPIVNDSSAKSLHLNYTNYLYIHLNNGETIMDTDLSTDDMLEIANSLPVE